MLPIVIPGQHLEYFDERTEEFVTVDVPETYLELEHSLISLQKWEQKWHKAFLSDYEEKTHEMMCDYVRCMALNGKNIDPKVYNYIPAKVMDEITSYIKDPMTAAWFNDGLIGAQKTSSEVITAEIIYYWMITLNIPVEFKKWHLNSLMTLIKVVSIKNSPPQKVDPAQAARERDRLNRERRAKYNSKG